MSEQHDSGREALTGRLQVGLAKAEGRMKGLQEKNSRYIWLSLTLGGAATIVAATASAIGSVLGPWKVTCGVVAAMTAGATVFTGLHKQLGISEQLARASVCAGKLDALLIGLTVTRRDPAEVAREYEEVVGLYREFLV